MSNIQPTPTGSKAQHQQNLHAAQRSTSPNYGNNRRSPYDYYSFSNVSAKLEKMASLRARNNYRSNNAGYQHPLFPHAATESVPSTSSQEPVNIQSRPLYSQTFPNYGMPTFYPQRGHLGMPTFYPQRGYLELNKSNAGYHTASNLPGEHTYFGTFGNSLKQSGTSSRPISPPANHPLLPDRHGMEEEEEDHYDDDDNDSLFSDNASRRDTYNEEVECVDLVSNSSVNGAEDIEENEHEDEMSTSSINEEKDIEENGKENDHEGVMSTSSINEEKDIATFEDSKTKEAVSTLAENLKSLYLKKFNTDVTIKVQNKKFTAHKVILNARLECFASMFDHNFSENEDGIIEITDCDPESFEDFLLFLYTADLNIVSSQNVIGLYQTSEKYRCKELLEKCVRYMIQELSVDAFCDYFHIATLHNESDLLEAVINFFIKNAKQIFLTAKWLIHMEEHPSLCNELLIKYSNADSSCRK